MKSHSSDLTLPSREQTTVPTKARTGTSHYRPEIDGLRALAVIPVVLFHMGLGCPGGFVGVDVFFIISGYLITRLINEEIQRGAFSFARFWERRVRRIFPAMFVVLMVTFIAGWMLLLPDDFELFARSAMAQVGLVANMFFRKQSNYFAPASETMPLLHTWSLSVEEQFYVAFPLILFLAFKRSPTSLPKIITLVLCLSFGFSVYSSYDNPAKSFFYLQSRAWELSLGSLLVFIPAPRLQSRWGLEILSWAGIAGIIFAIAYYDGQTRFPGTAALLPCLGACLFIWANSSKPTSAGALMSIKPIVFIGLISYSLYLWHWPFIVFAKYWNWGQWSWSHSSVSQKLGLLLVIIVLSAASWRWVETPFRRRTILQDRKKIFIFAASACALVLAAAGYVRAANGVPSRFPAEALRYAAMKNDRAFLNNIKASRAIKGDFVEIGEGSTNSPVTLLIWGDSHAMAITPALASLCKEHHVRGVQATHSSTAPLIGFKQVRGLRGEAADFGNAVIDYVAKNRVSNVLLAARWNGYPFNEDFKTGLLQTVKQLRDAGAKVWIMKEVPNHPEDVPRAAAKEILAGRNPERLGVSLAEHIEKHKEMNQLFEKAELAGANILDPVQYLVNSNNVCIAVADGKSLYVDFHHLTVTGAMRVKPLFEKLFSAHP